MTFVLAVLLSFTLVLAGCESESPSEKPDDLDIETEIEEEPTSDEVEEEATAADAELVFDQVKDMDHYHYEVLTELADGSTYTTKLWFSGNKTRVETDTGEEMGEIIFITDEDEGVTYLYMVKENMALKMGYDEILEVDEFEQTDNYVELLEEISDDEEVQVENGTFEGEKVKILTSEIEGFVNKMWISDKTNLPLKTETYEDEKLISTSIFELFEEEAVDPAIFELPDDVEIQDMTSFMD